MSGRGVGPPASRKGRTVTGYARDGSQPGQRRRKALQTRLFSIRSRGDLRSSWPDRSFAGISGYDRLCAGIPVRDLRGMKTSRRSSAPNPATKHADLQGLYGSDGTRTRDLRRDRPVTAFRGRPRLCGDSWREQGFSSVLLRGLPGVVGSFRRPPAGSARDRARCCTAPREPRTRALDPLLTISRSRQPLATDGNDVGLCCGFRRSAHLRSIATVCDR
jgi:hypothetical protein